MAKDFDLLVIAKVNLWWQALVRLGQEDDVATLLAMASLGQQAMLFGLVHELDHANVTRRGRALSV